jgi:hypothetical protein
MNLTRHERFDMIMQPILIKRTGRFKVVLCCGGKKYQRTIHRLVLEAFVGPCPEGMEACHRDDNPANNRLENLRWDTHVSNCEDRTRNRVNVGEKNATTRLSNGDVREIRAMHVAGKTYNEICERFGIGRVYAWELATGRKRAYA